MEAQEQGEEPEVQEPMARVDGLGCLIGPPVELDCRLEPDRNVVAPLDDG